MDNMKGQIREWLLGSVSEQWIQKKLSVKSKSPLLNCAAD